MAGIGQEPVFGQNKGLTPSVDPMSPIGIDAAPASNIGKEPVYGASQAGRITEQDQAQAPDTNYLSMGKSIGIGAAKGAASVLDFFLTPTLQGLGTATDIARSSIVNREDGSKMRPVETPTVKPGNTFSGIAERQLPEPEYPGAARIAEGTVGGATMGPAGAVIGGGTAAGTEILNKVRPDSPISNVVEPAIASMFLMPGSVSQFIKFGRILGEGTGILSKSPLVQARIDQGISAGTPASVSDSDFWYKLQRGVGEALFGKSLSKAKEAEGEQLAGAVDRQAERLYPGETTRQSVGADVQQGITDGVATVKRVFRNFENSLDAAVPPATTDIDMMPYVTKAINDMTSVRGAAIPLSGGATYSGDVMVDRLMDNIIQNNRGNTLSVEAVRNLKQQVGDALEITLLNGDQSKRNLRIMYGILADAQESAYVGTLYARAYRQLKDAEHEMYNSIENFAEPLVRAKASPEIIANQLASGMKLGDTRFEHAMQIIEQSSPGMRQQFGSMILRDLGMNNQKEFSPTRFFTNWQKIPPESKAALFGDANGDLPRAYDQLALLAQNQARSQSAVNPSKSAGTWEVLHLLERFGALAGGVVGYETSKKLMSGQGSEDGVMPGLGGATAGSLVMSTLGMAAAGKLMTNPAFVRWLATPTPIDSLPMHLKALSAVAGASPEIQKDVKSFQDFVGKNLPWTKGFDHSQNTIMGIPPNPPKFAEGGPFMGNMPSISNPATAANGGNKSSSFLNNEKLPKIETVLDKFLNNANHNKNFTSYAEGGSVVDRFTQAVNYISQNTGVSPEVAKGAVKYMYKNESGLDPNIVNSIGAYGIAQMLGPRKKAMMTTYGNRPSFENQLEHIVTELKTGADGGGTLKALLGAKAEKQGYDIWGSMFERPGAAALAKAGVNYSPGTPSVMASSNNPNTKPNDSTKTSLVDQFMGVHQMEDSQPQEEPDLFEPMRNALSDSTDDPATKGAIHAILGRKT